jgi:hypothetical protein
MKTSKFLFLVMIGVGLIEASCGVIIGNPAEDDDSSKKTKIDLAVEGARDSALLLQESSISVFDSNGEVTGSISLTMAKIGLKDIRIKADSGDSKSYDFDGPYVVDLLTDTITPNPSAVAIEAGTYKDVELRLDDIREDDVEGIPSSDPVIDRSIYLKGTYQSNSGSTVPFELAYEFGETFRVAGDSDEGVKISDGVTNEFIIAFNIDRWFKLENDYFEDITGDIVLNEEADGIVEDIRKVIKDNIKNSADYGIR